MAVDQDFRGLAAERRSLDSAPPLRTEPKLGACAIDVRGRLRWQSPDADLASTNPLKNVWPAPLASRLRQALFGRAQTYPA